MRSLLFVALGAALLMGCGGSKAVTPTSDPVLHLGSGYMAESAYRAQTRAALATSNGAVFCRAFQGLTDEEAIELQIKLKGSPTVEPSNISADQARAGAILKEECARILKGS